MIVRIEEQLYKKKSKIYWHGSHFPEINQAKSHFGMVYITQNLEYALKYARSINFDGWDYLYQCHLYKPLNIFNTKDKVDRFKFKKYLLQKEDLLEEDIEQLLDYLADNDWLKLGSSKRNFYLNVLINLQYDGFFNFEIGDNPAIGLFDADLLKVDHIYSKEDIEKIINGIPKYRDKQRKQIKDYLSGNPDAEISLIGNLKSLEKKSTEEFIKDQEKELAFLEESYKEDDSWRTRKEIEMFREKVKNLKRKYIK